VKKYTKAKFIEKKTNKQLRIEFQDTSIGSKKSYDISFYGNSIHSSINKELSAKKALQLYQDLKKYIHEEINKR